MARDLRAARAARLAIGTALGLLTLAACGTATVEGTVVADEIEVEFGERTGVKAELVSCPETIPRSEGERFECTVLVEGGTTTPVTGTMTDNEGNFDWEPERDVVDGDRIVAEIQAELGPEVEVTCDAAIFADPGDPFTCEAVEAGRAPATILVVLEEDGSVTWSVELD